MTALVSAKARRKDDKHREAIKKRQDNRRFIEQMDELELFVRSIMVGGSTTRGAR